MTDFVLVFEVNDHLGSPWQGPRETATVGGRGSLGMVKCDSRMVDGAGSGTEKESSGQLIVKRRPEGHFILVFDYIY